MTRREKKRRDKRRKELTYKDIRENREVLAYLKKGNDNLGTMGFTDHSGAHCAMVAERAAMILEKFGYSEHDRVNYAVTEASLTVCPEKNLVTLDLQIDENICSMLEYFEIFLERMLMCRRASEMLGAKFKMTANGSKIV